MRTLTAGNNITLTPGEGVLVVAAADAADAVLNSEVDQDVKTLALPANTTVSAFGATIVDDADAEAVRTTIGAAALADVADTVVLTQSEYNALTPDAETIYYIVG